MMPSTRVVVGVGESPEGWTTLRHAAAAARHRRALLVPVIAFEGEGERHAYARLDDILTDTLGPEESVLVEPRAVRAASLAEAVALVAVEPGDEIFTQAPHAHAWDRLTLRLHRRLPAV